MSITSPTRDSRPHLFARRLPANVLPLSRVPSSARVGPAPRVDWKRAYHRRALVVDILIIAAVITTAEFCRVLFRGSAAWSDVVTVHHIVLRGVLLGVAWVIALELQKSRDLSLVGVGVDEYARVISATLAVFGLAAVASLLLQVRLSRGFLAVALILGLAGLIAGRHLLRKYLARERTAGRYVSQVVVLGGAESVRMLCERFSRSAESGYRVVGACVPGFTDVGVGVTTSVGVVPILGDDNAVEIALRETGADVVAVAAVEHIGHENMKKLAWKLESRGVGLIVVPGVSDIAGPRLLMRPIDKLPLFHIASPNQEGFSAVAKRAFDLAFGAFALFCAAPILMLAAIAIKLNDGGPVLFRQERVGLHGKPFRIIKFRTMVVDAEARKETERDTTNNHGIFYKSANDSRITKVGKFLRASSIDELPQLLNVLGGSMSVVGPRPLVPGEGEGVEDFVARRGLVKPGITGLWQVSGRSDLSEDDRVNLDHSYLDSWSCVLDLVIVWRTVAAVLKRDGAY